MKKILALLDTSTICYSTYDTRNQWIVDLVHQNGEAVLHLVDGRYITLSAKSRKGATCTNMVFLKDPAKDHPILSELYATNGKGKEVEVSLVAEG